MVIHVHHALDHALVVLAHVVAHVHHAQARVPLVLVRVGVAHHALVHAWEVAGD